MSFRYQPGRKASSNVKAPLLIAAGLIGVPLAIALSHAWSDDEGDAPSPAGTDPTTVDANTAYPMNHFVPGAGYYHVPYHAWFPFPFNYHDSRGWYRGGRWRAAPQEDDNERRGTQPSRGGATYAGSSHGGGAWLSSRPSPDAVQRANAGAISAHGSGSAGGQVIRGGFGFSAHPGVS